MIATIILVAIFPVNITVNNTTIFLIVSFVLWTTDMVVICEQSNTPERGNFQ